MPSSVEHEPSGDDARSRTHPHKSQTFIRRHLASQRPQSSAAHRNELLTERLVPAEVAAMDTKDRMADTDLPHPDLNRMYQEVVKLRFRVRQAEAHALWPDSNTSGQTVSQSRARDDSRGSAMTASSTLRRFRPGRAVSGRRGGRPCRRLGGRSHG